MSNYIYPLNKLGNQTDGVAIYLGIGESGHYITDISQIFLNKPSVTVGTTNSPAGAYLARSNNGTARWLTARDLLQELKEELMNPSSAVLFSSLSNPKVNEYGVILQGDPGINITVSPTTVNHGGTVIATATGVNGGNPSLTSWTCGNGLIAAGNTSNTASTTFTASNPVTSAGTISNIAAITLSETTATATITGSNYINDPYSAAISSYIKATNSEKTVQKSVTVAKRTLEPKACSWDYVGNAETYITLEPQTNQSTVKITGKTPGTATIKFTVTWVTDESTKTAEQTVTINVPEPEALPYWYVGTDPITTSSVPGSGTVFAMNASTTLGWHNITGTPTQIQVGPTERLSIKKNWYIAIPNDLNITKPTSGGLVDGSITSSVITLADGTDYRVFVTPEGKTIDYLMTK